MSSLPSASSAIREPKNRVRYEPAAGEPAVGTLYQPRRLTVTLTPELTAALALTAAPATGPTPDGGGSAAAA